MISENGHRAIAAKWFEAFNKHDIDELLSLYHEDAQHYSPKLKVRYPDTNGIIHGKVALREWWRDAFNRLPSLQYIPIAMTADAKRVFMEYERYVENEPNIQVAEVLDIKDGLILASRVYHG